MGEFLGGVYMGFMGGVVFSIVVGLLMVLSGGLLKKKEKPPERASLKFKCPHMNIIISEEFCKFHRGACPEACVNCLIAQGEAA